MGENALLLGGLSSKPKARTASVLVFAVASIAACAVLFLVIGKAHVKVSALAQSAVQYYYVRNVAPQSKTLPTHLMINKAEYMLVSAPQAVSAPRVAPLPLSQLDDPAAGFCSLAGLKAEATKVFAKWDLCTAAKDYREPNKDAKRRLMSAESQRTQSLKWAWVPDQGEPAIPPPSAVIARDQMLEASISESDLSGCLGKATKDTCPKLNQCKDNVCGSYYSDPDVERLCGVCAMSFHSWYWTCFAVDAPVVAAGRGAVRVGELAVGDRVEAAGAGGERVFSRVYFAHEHAGPAPVLQLHHAKGVLELSPMHSLPVHTEACGDTYCGQARVVPAKEVRAGDSVYVSAEGGFVAAAITAVTERQSRVRYVLTEAENLVVGGVVASVVSTGAGPLETLPFRALDWAAPGALQVPAVAAALAAVLESPALRAAEEALVRITEAFQILARKPPAPLAASARLSPALAAAAASA